MTKPWSEVAGSSGFKQLPPEQQDSARRQYFDDVVAPKVPEGQREVAWDQFSTDVGVGRRELPAGVEPSRAGGGRGSVNPAMSLADAKPSRAQRIAEMDEATDEVNPTAMASTATANPVITRPGRRESVDDRRTRSPGRVTDADIPGMTLGSVARDTASGVMQIVPTALKGVGELSRLATGDRVGKGLSDFADDTNKAVQQRVGSERSQLQRQRFEQDMADPALDAADVVGSNPGALADQVLPTVGSMALPVGAASTAGKLAQASKAAQLAKVIDEGTVLARANTAREAAAVGTTVAQNAASTYSTVRDKGGDQGQSYLAAALTAPATYIAGRATGGAAEAQAAKLLSGAAGTAGRAATTIPKAMAKEGGQEIGEEAGQVLGETTGLGEEFDAGAAGKRLAVAGTLGAVVGGGVDASGQVAQFAQERERVKRLKAAGETDVADMLERRVNLQEAEANTATELGALIKVAPQHAEHPAFQQAYKAQRVEGVKPAEAAARAAITTGFGELATQSGLSQKAIDSALDAVKKMPMAKVPGFLDRYVATLNAKGMGTPAEPGSIAGTLSTVGDTAMTAAVDSLYADDVRKTMSDVEALESQQNQTPALETPAPAATQTIAPVSTRPEIDVAAHDAATSPLNGLPEPSQAQKEAGNYQKGHIRVQGMDIAIENPEGSQRSGTSPDGTEWTNTMAGHYGYIKGTVGNDKDHVDTYVGHNPDSGRVFVIDQVNPDGRFDEHKIMLGYDTPEQAQQAYRDSFDADWQGFGAMTELPVDAFKSWVRDGVKSKPLGSLQAPDVQNAPVRPRESTETQAEAAATEAPAPEGGDAQGPAAAGSAAGEALLETPRVILGRNNVPMEEGGKPYKTRLAADEARRQQPMMRVIRTDGGFALTEKTPAQLAAQDRAAQRLRNPQTSPAGQPIPAHAMIASAGGLAPDERADMGMEGNVTVGNRKLFAGAGKGLTIERVTEKLIEDGYLPEGAGHDQARALIKRSLTQPQYTAEGFERMAEAETQARFDAAMTEEEAIDEAVAQIEALSDNQFDVLLDAEIPWDAPSNTDTVAAMKAIGFTDQEIQDATANQSGEPQDDSSGRGEPDEGAASQAQADPGDRDEAPGQTQEVSPAPAFESKLRADGTLAITGDAKAIREMLTAIPAKSLASMKGGILVGRTQADKAAAILRGEKPKLTAREAAEAGAAAREAEKKAKAAAARAKPAAGGLTVGIMPGNAEPVTVKDGIVYIGKTEALDFDSGEPVRVKDGASDSEIVNALKVAGALSRRQRVFGLKDDAAPTATEPSSDEQRETALAAIRETLRSVAKDSEKSGDVGVTVGSKIRFAPFDSAVTAARAAVDMGVKPVPFQIHNEVGIRLGDTDRVIAAIGLTAPTKEDVLAQQQAAADGNKAATKAATDSENKAKADAERNEFTLTGSDRAADVGAAGGQGSMFAKGFDSDAFARMFRPPTAMAVSDVQKAVDKLTSAWKSGPTIKVVATPEDLPIDAPADARGLIHEGTAYIVARNHVNRDAVARTLGHEAVGHYGLWRMLGDDGTKKFNRNLQLALKSGNVPLNKLRDKVRAAYVDEKGKFNLSAAEESSEIAAFAVEDAIDPATGEFKPGFGFVKEVYAKVAEFLRSLGITIKFTNSELHGMLVAAMRGLKAGARLDGGGQVMVAAARTPPAALQPIQTPAGTAFQSDDVVLGKPRLEQRQPGGDVTRIAYEIRDPHRFAAAKGAGATPAEAREASNVGYVVMDMGKDGQFKSLRNIEVFESKRGGGMAGKVVGSIMATLPEGGKLHIHDILPTATGFWDKMGAKFARSDDFMEAFLTPAQFRSAYANTETRAAGEEGPDSEPGPTLYARGREGGSGNDGQAAPAKDAAASQAVLTDTKAFKDWFDGSKVVDAEGKPLPVYHGSTTKFDAFDPAKMGSATGAKSAQGGFFFASEKSTADTYASDVFKRSRKARADLASANADIARLTGESADRGALLFFQGKFDGTKDEAAIERAIEKMQDAERKLENAADDYFGGTPRRAKNGQVVEAYLAIKNPLVHDQKGAESRDAAFSDLIAKAKAAGNDGVIIRNTKDDGSASKADDSTTDVYVAFDPTQIKSTDNSGDFDPSTPKFAFARGTGNLFQPNIWTMPDATRVDRVIYELQDGKVDLKRAQEAIKASGQDITEQYDARLAETLYPGRVAYRSATFLDVEAKPLLEAMARNKVDMDELADYLHARGAEERNAQIAKVNPNMPDGGAGTNTKGELMTNQAAREYLANVPKERKVVLDAMAKRVDTITAGTRQLLVAEGLEKQETIDAWEGVYKNYVPMFRDEAESAMPPHPQGSGFQVKGNASRRATGSTKEVTNILAHVLMQREAAITRAEKNRVALALYGQALSHPNPDFWTTIRPSMKAAEISAELQAMGVDPMTAEVGMEGVPTIRTVDPITQKVVDRPNPIYRNLPGAIPLKVNGADRVLMLNVKTERGQRLAESLKNLDGLTQLDIAGNIIGKSTRWLAAVNTQYNPAFGLVNLTRDTLGGAINLGSTELRGNALKVLIKTPAAILGIARELASGGQTGTWQSLYRQFQADGGQTGFKENFRDPNDRAKAVEKELAALGKSKLSPGRATHAILDLLDGFNTTLENAVRLSAYKAALDKGMSRAEAARLGRELTVDFNRKGRAGREVGPLYAFFNASVQGGARTIQALKGPTGAKIIAGGLGLGILQALMLAAADYDDDDIPEFVKTRALIIPLFGREKKYIAIPYPLGLHVLPNTGRVMAELTLNGGKDIGKRSVNAIGEIASAFNPLGGGNIFTADGALKTVAPTVVDPIIELAANKNFAGGTIEKAGFGTETDNRPGVARAKESTQRSTTGQAYMAISKAINTMTGGTDYEAGLASPTPERVRYIAQTVGGGVLREFEKTINSSTAAARGEKVKMSGIPVAGRFYGEVDDDQVQTSRYYENVKRLKKLDDTTKAMEKAGNVKAADAVHEKNPEAQLIQAWHQAQSNIRALNKEAVQTITNKKELAKIDEDRLYEMRDLNEQIEKLERENGKVTLADRLRAATRPKLAENKP